MDGGLVLEDERIYELVIAWIGSMQPIDYAADAVKHRHRPLSIKSMTARDDRTRAAAREPQW
jgi:hypothetical protein